MRQISFFNMKGRQQKSRKESNLKREDEKEEPVSLKVPDSTDVIETPNK